MTTKRRAQVKSSADAGMNTLRVWGGGIFYPSAFYDAADEYGVMIYHDMQYASLPGQAPGMLNTIGDSVCLPPIIGICGETHCTLASEEPPLS